MRDNSPFHLIIPSGSLGHIKLLNLTKGQESFFKGYMVVAENVTKRNFEQIVEANPDIRNLWYLKGRILYSEFTQSIVHSSLCQFFSNATSEMNKNIRGDCAIHIDTDVSREFGDAHKAPDVCLTFEKRESHGIKSPTLVGEIGYCTSLEHLCNLAEVYLAESEENEDKNDIMGYFVVQLTYPYSLSDSNQFKMLFLYFEYGNDPVRRPTKVISCGTLPVSAEVINVLNELTGLNPLDPLYNVICEGYGFGGPPCDIANRMNASYNITFPGNTMISMDREATIVVPELGDSALFDYNFNLYDLQEVAKTGLRRMDRLVLNRTVQAQNIMDRALNEQEAEAIGLPVPELSVAQIRVRALQLNI